MKLIESLKEDFRVLKLGKRKLTFKEWLIDPITNNIKEIWANAVDLMLGGIGVFFVLAYYFIWFIIMLAIITVVLRIVFGH